MRSKRLPGLPVLTLDEGVQLGRVRSVVVDARAKRVAALVVSQRGLGQKMLLPMEGVRALGSDAVTVDRGDVLIPLREAQSYEGLLKSERVRVVGTPVVTVGGELAGVVRDFEISGQGAVEAIYVSKGIFPSMLRRHPSVPGALIVALGKDAVVVAEKAVEHMKPKASRPEEETRRRSKPFRLFSLAREGAATKADTE